MARAQGISPALLGRWQRMALEQAVPSSAEREESKRLRAELKRVETERDMVKKAVTIGMLQPHHHNLSRESAGTQLAGRLRNCAGHCA